MRGSWPFARAWWSHSIFAKLHFSASPEK
jgi:hypothetical protein